MVITIERGIPIPVTRHDVRETLRKMKVGDSFTLPDGLKGGTVYSTAKLLRLPIRIKKYDDGTKRVWRVDTWWKPADNE